MELRAGISDCRGTWDAAESLGDEVRPSVSSGDRRASERQHGAGPRSGHPETVACGRTSVADDPIYRSAVASHAVLLLVVTSASAAPILVTGGILTGATGVDVGGTLYDVEFLDGSSRRR